MDVLQVHMIVEAGNDAKVTALVYIAAFAPVREESVSATPPSGAPVPPILRQENGFLVLGKAAFAATFAAELAPEKTAFLADSQVPMGVAALEGEIAEQTWKSKPSGYLVATEDRMILPAPQRAMAKHAGSTVVETSGSHAIDVSQPAAVAALIEAVVASADSIEEESR